MNLRWLFRMARWARNPPSEGRVRLVLGIALVCIALFLIERFIGWPEALSLPPRGERWRP